MEIGKEYASIQCGDVTFWPRDGDSPWGKADQLVSGGIDDIDDFISAR